MKRCILFAGYKYSDEIDEVDFYHIEKLAEIGDLFCLYDNADVSDGDIQKLLQLGAKKAIATRHAEYDFGSWKRLFRIIGWDKVAQYDEVILVNNSLILIGDLKRFLSGFEKNDAELFALGLLDEHYTGPTMMAKDYLEYDSISSDNSMFPSVFWAMKSSLVNRPFVQNFFENIRQEDTRLDVCYKYEREFSRKIIRRNIKTKLFNEFVYPNSFLYTEIAFSLAKSGFPYLKRKTLASEFYVIRTLYSRLKGLCANIPEQAAKALYAEYMRLGVRDEAFDPEWYLDIYPDVKEHQMDPEYHYVTYGKNEGRFKNAGHCNFAKQIDILENSVESDIFEIDKDWYLLANPDVSQAKIPAEVHFEEYGEHEGRAPNCKFSAGRYVRENPEIDLSHTSPFAHFVQTRDKKYEAEQSLAASSYSATKKLLIFFNVARDLVGGGMLSINRFATSAKKMVGETGYDVAVSGVPLGRRAVKYSKFKTILDQIEFRFIAENTDPDDVVIFLPEVFAIQFINDLSAFELGWILQRKNLKFVIMNQNDELMPSPKEVQDSFFPLTANVVISTAHWRYCTQRMSSLYMVPVTQLTPFLPDMKLSKFSEKEKIVLLSDDPITNDPSGLSRDYVVQMLKARMPEFEFITIKNMALDDYLDLASRAMFSITFGEGMDGYYIEPILAGAISFAVYNSTFFPTEFKNHPGIFQDWNSVVSRLPEIVNNLLDAVSYDTTSQFLRENLGEIYSETRSTTELLKLIGGEADFAPLPRYGAANKNPIRQKLLSLGINFYEFGDQHVCALPDGSVLRNFGEDVYDLSREIFINKDFEFELDPKKKYVLIDLGANIGLTTIYLLRKFSNIIKSYAFEPVELTARIARENFRGNQLHERVDLYQIGLSNSFSRKHLEFTPSQSTLFSTDSNALPETPDWDYKFSNNGGHVDVEVARANAELDFILKRHSNERLILKCDTRGSELAVVSSLAANRELTRFDNIVVQSYRDDVDSMIGLLKTNGFSVEVKEACSKNVYHTIRATKDANMQN